MYSGGIKPTKRSLKTRLRGGGGVGIGRGCVSDHKRDKVAPTILTLTTHQGTESTAVLIIPWNRS